MWWCALFCTTRGFEQGTYDVDFQDKGAYDVDFTDGYSTATQQLPFKSRLSFWRVNSWGTVADALWSERCELRHTFAHVGQGRGKIVRIMTQSNLSPPQNERYEYYHHAPTHSKGVSSFQRL
jgi:hypothetical protein